MDPVRARDFGARNLRKPFLWREFFPLKYPSVALSYSHPHLKEVRRMAGKEATAASAGRKSAAARSRKASSAAQGRQGTSAPPSNTALSSSPASSVPVHATDPPQISPFSTSRRFPAAPPSTGGRFPGAPSSMAAQSPWMPPRPMHPSYLDPSNWDTETVPDGGFLNFLQSQSSQNNENFHFTGNISHYTQFNQTTSYEGSDSSPLLEPTENTEHVRKEKRIFWSAEEDSRLMSAWLKCSLDSIQGNDKRNDQYWNDVAKTYNETTPSQRMRTMKQAKDRWHRINKLADLFHSAYLKAQRLNTSGFNEEKWVAEAHKWYEIDNADLKLGRFQLMDVWYAIRSEPKWQTYNDGLKSARKRHSSIGHEEEGKEKEENMVSGNDIPRPLGQKAAKRALYESKGQQPTDGDDDDVQVLKEAQANRMKVLEVQQKISLERLESAKVSHAAAREHKEAKNIELTVKMMETYNCLLKKDVFGMSEQERDEHAAMLKHLKRTLYPELF